MNGRFISLNIAQTLREYLGLHPPVSGGVRVVHLFNVLYRDVHLFNVLCRVVHLFNVLCHVVHLFNVLCRVVHLFNVLCRIVLFVLCCTCMGLYLQLFVV